MAENFELESNLREYFDELKEHFVNMDSKMYDIERKAMNKAGNIIKREVKKSYKQFFSNAPGKHKDEKSSGKFNFKPKEPENLYQSIKQRAWKKPGLGQIIYAPVHSPYNAVLYGFALQKGYRYKVKTKDGSTHEVIVKPIEFLTKPAETAFNGHQIYTEMDKVVQKELNKLAKDPKHYKIKEEE